MKENNYRICSKTIMDTTADPDITFDEQGVSNYVKEYNELIALRVPEKSLAKKKLDRMISKIKKDGEGKEYDCLIGISGGVDSTYVAYLTKKLGLRPLAVHMDNGWNSELAVSNIEKTIKKLDIDLHTEVLDWEEFKSIQLAFLKASTPDGEIPTDHTIYAVTMKIAAKYGIKYIISGSNIKTEGILPRSWARGHLDWKYIKSVCKIHGNGVPVHFPHITMPSVFYYLYIKGIVNFPILNLIEYNKANALEILSTELGWQYYGIKHYESVYTRFYQGYVLPRKFKIDKRRAHLSSLICSGQISRDQALTEIEKAPYLDMDLEKQDLDFVIKKLEISKVEFERIMQLPIKTIEDYPNSFDKWEFVRKTYWKLKSRI
ncbi:MAG: N-acetyl sugar amidotransferase [Sphingobacteriales bacterium]|jgi:N-acetyl sugar amidotransferase|nr:N-acetyl sugar amidotransferase [Sphingobacteriales bacterium]